MSKQNLNNFLFAITLCGAVLYFSSAYAQENEVEADKETEVSSQTLTTYTWEDFLTNKECGHFVKELASHSEDKELYQNLKVYCHTYPLSTWEDLLNTFRREKKQILKNQILKSDSSYIRYVKVVPYLLFDIQNTKATGTEPIDILDQIEQAIIDRQLDSISTLSATLPQTWSNGLRNTKIITDKLLKIKEQLNLLNETEGDKND